MAQFQELCVIPIWWSSIEQIQHIENFTSFQKGQRVIEVNIMFFQHFESISKPVDNWKNVIFNEIIDLVSFSNCIYYIIYYEKSVFLSGTARWSLYLWPNSLLLLLLLLLLLDWRAKCIFNFSFLIVYLCIAWVSDYYILIGKTQEKSN